jgi:hypothetical protein
MNFFIIKMAIRFKMPVTHSLLHNLMVPILQWYFHGEESVTMDNIDDFGEWWLDQLQSGKIAVLKGRGGVINYTVKSVNDDGICENVDLRNILNEMKISNWKDGPKVND